MVVRHPNGDRRTREVAPRPEIYTLGIIGYFSAFRRQEHVGHDNNGNQTLPRHLGSRPNPRFALLEGVTRTGFLKLHPSTNGSPSTPIPSCARAEFLPSLRETGIGYSDSTGSIDPIFGMMLYVVGLHRIGYKEKVMTC